MSPTSINGLSMELVEARHALGAIQRERDRSNQPPNFLTADYLSVIAAAAVSIATSLETWPRAVGPHPDSVRHHAEPDMF